MKIGIKLCFYSSTKTSLLIIENGSLSVIWWLGALFHYLFCFKQQTLKCQSRAYVSPAELCEYISANSPIQQYFQLHLVSEASFW